MPGGKNLPYFRASVGLTISTAFELHAFLGKGDFVLGQVEGGADLGDVREEDKGGYTDREGNYAVDDEEPVSSSLV
jgi:hypothetical protein